MIILAIDTSCDETCIAIVEVAKGRFYTKSNVVSSQIKIHKKYGGVVPFLAKREHQKNLIPVLKESLKKAKILKKETKLKTNNFTKVKKILTKEENLLRNVYDFLIHYKNPLIDLIAVTKGPGLEPCLWTGINFAKALSFFWRKPIIPVNHLEGHIFANFLGKSQILNLKSQIFPAVALIASGGHTELVLVRRIKQYKLIGETLDDAAGECLDKIAKIINLPYPGGPEIEKIAKFGSKETYNFPRPMIWSKDYNFSFSGLKTSVLYLTKKLKNKDLKKIKTKANISASAQQAVFDVLIVKTIKAVKEKNAKTILAGGGVMANKTLKRQFKLKIKKILGSQFLVKKQKNQKINFLVPSKKLCTDNAAMIAVAAYFNKNKKIAQNNIRKIASIKADSNLNL